VDPRVLSVNARSSPAKRVTTSSTVDVWARNLPSFVSVYDFPGHFYVFSWTLFYFRFDLPFPLRGYNIMTYVDLYVYTSKSHETS
jgi:hypothetical protein